MSTTPITRPFYRISTVDDGNILALGNTKDNKKGGEFSVQFVPDSDFVGSIQVVGHIMGIPGRSDEEAAPDFQFPYRKIYINGVPADFELSHETLVGPCAIQIPANNWVIGLLVACEHGEASLFWRAISESVKV